MKHIDYINNIAFSEENLETNVEVNENTNEEINVSFRTDQIGTALGYLGKGMLGIFIVIGIIIGVITALNKIKK